MQSWGKSAMVGLLVSLAGFGGGCVVGASDMSPAASNDPLEYVDDMPADSALRTCAELNARMDAIEALFPTAAESSLADEFAENVKLTIVREDYGSVPSEGAAQNIEAFASVHSMARFERLHTLNSRSCIAGAFIGNVTDGTQTFRVTLGVRSPVMDSAAMIDSIQIDESATF